MRKLFVLLISAIAFAFIFSSCSDEKETIKECEKNQTTDVKIVNNTGIPITVKIYITDSGFTEEQTIAIGGDYTYPNLKATKAEFWINVGPYWEWSNEYTLTACELFTFTWN